LVGLRGCTCAGKKVPPKNHQRRQLCRPSSSTVSSTFFVPIFNHRMHLGSRVAIFLLVQNTKTGEKYTKLPQSIPSGHKIFPMAVK
jgi:hypothetical protein